MSQPLQYSTFYLNGQLYGIDVMKVQEVAKPMPITRIQLATAFIKGIVNLRGQIATAISLRELFQLDAVDCKDKMTVVCHLDGNLVSFVVDEIGDVIQVEKEAYEDVPETLPQSVRQYLGGVYKLENKILSCIDLDKVLNILSKKEDVAA